ncbi:MAG: putative colanic acid biosynthesis acetyltransferase [Salibacteraceae bacterium]
MHKTDLSKFNNAWYYPGAGFMVRLLWYMTNTLFFQSRALLPYSWKAAMLVAFGAKVGKNVVIKPGVNIKYPWKLSIGENSWIGENVWIDCLDRVEIGSNVCVSQGALLLSGNHDYTQSTFDLMLKPIVLEDGAWVGAKSIVTQGVVMRSHAVLAAGSLASGELKANGIYRGNPAVFYKEREFVR